MIPQPMIPPTQYWFDPQNNPYWAYYYQGFDPSCFGYPPPPNHSRSQTPQPAMAQNVPAPVPNGSVPYFYPYPPPPFMWYPPYMGFRPISASRETTPYSDNETSLKTPTNEDRNRRAVSCTPTCCQHAKPFTVEDNRKKFHTVEEPLIDLNVMKTVNAESSEDEEYRANALTRDNSSRRSLMSVPSVNNIHLFTEENADLPIEELKAKPIIEEDDKTDSEDETTEAEDEISQDTATGEMHLPHQLSIIYEENDDSVDMERRANVVSRSSTLSDCSTTLMEEDNISVDCSGDEMEEENSVTVRLPLKFSFTRSKDNLVNTTLTVGESESENNSVKSKSPESIKSISPFNRRVSQENTNADVSVTVSLKSKSKTPERIITPNLSLRNNSIESDPECSVSISLPRRSKSKELSLFKACDDKSENSGENKKHIDTSLYTSLDAFEEIKKGMAEITNSLCSKLCTMRKSALNIPGNDPYRSSSTSQIESIDTDSDNDLSLSFDENDENGLENENNLENDEAKVEDMNKEETLDFWGQLSIANKNYEDPTVSGYSSKRSSRYWFEDDCDEIENKNVNKVEEEIKVEEKPSQAEGVVKQTRSNDLDFWQNHDENNCTKFRANEYFAAQEAKAKENFNGIEINGNNEPAEQANNDNEELESDEEWTEEEVEVTDDEEPEVNPVKPMEVTSLQVNEKVEDESDYEEESENEDEEIAKPEVSAEENCSEQSEDEESFPDCNKSSSNKISKGKSLVNVNSYVASNTSKDNSVAVTQSINEDEDSEESEYSSAEEAEEEQNDSALPANSSNHLYKHSNDDCQLTRNQTSHDDKVLNSQLTAIHSIESKSNLTSESGISFEQNDPDSEDGYEEDSDEEVQPDEDQTVEKEIKVENVDEIKVNVKGKISMFEKAMSEEPSERIAKDSQRVPLKFAFRQRESSEPPTQKPVFDNKSESPQRAMSEVREVYKNQKLVDLINQKNSLPSMTGNEDEKQRKSVKEKISSFETNDTDANEKRENYKRYGNSKKSIPLARSIDESCEEDSGVTSDFCKQFSENETDTENFPELRKLSRYQRANTHSRLFKLLQGDETVEENCESSESKEVEEVESSAIPYKPKKIIHNVSVTRRQNPKAALEAETMEQRRQRLCLPLSHQSSSGADSMSSSTTPSPTPGVINEKLVNELVQSLLSQKKGRAFRNLPIEKLHAAAVKILQEDIESTNTFSSADESTIPTVDSTPAITPQEFRNNSSYDEYYDSWDNRNEDDDFSDLNLIQSKAFKNLQEQQVTASKKLWSVRCPRILSSKSINKDLARLSEVRESESPEPNHSRSPSIRSPSKEPMSVEPLSIQERPKAKNCKT